MEQSISELYKLNDKLRREEEKMYDQLEKMKIKYYEMTSVSDKEVNEILFKRITAIKLVMPILGTSIGIALSMITKDLAYMVTIGGVSVYSSIKITDNGKLLSSQSIRTKLEQEKKELSKETLKKIRTLEKKITNINGRIASVETNLHPDGKVEPTPQEIRKMIEKDEREEIFADMEKNFGFHYNNNNRVNEEEEIEDDTMQKPRAKH